MGSTAGPEYILEPKFITVPLVVQANNNNANPQPGTMLTIVLHMFLRV